MANSQTPGRDQLPFVPMYGPTLDSSYISKNTNNTPCVDSHHNKMALPSYLPDQAHSRERAMAPVPTPQNQMGSSSFVSMNDMEYYPAPPLYPAPGNKVPVLWNQMGHINNTESARAPLFYPKIGNNDNTLWNQMDSSNHNPLDNVNSTQAPPFNLDFENNDFDFWSQMDGSNHSLVDNIKATQEPPFYLDPGNNGSPPQYPIQGPGFQTQNQSFNTTDKVVGSPSSTEPAAPKPAQKIAQNTNFNIREHTLRSPILDCDQNNPARQEILNGRLPSLGAWQDIIQVQIRTDKKTADVEKLLCSRSRFYDINQELNTPGSIKKPSSWPGKPEAWKNHVKSNYASSGDLSKGYSFCKMVLEGPRVMHQMKPPKQNETHTPLEDSFNIISAAHFDGTIVRKDGQHDTRHLGRDATFKKIKEVSDSIPKKWVTAYLQNCPHPTCLSNRAKGEETKATGQKGGPGSKRKVREISEEEDPATPPYDKNSVKRRRRHQPSQLSQVDNNAIPDYAAVKNHEQYDPSGFNIGDNRAASLMDGTVGREYQYNASEPSKEDYNLHLIEAFNLESAQDEISMNSSALPKEIQRESSTVLDPAIEQPGAKPVNASEPQMDNLAGPVNFNGPYDDVFNRELLQLDGDQFFDYNMYGCEKVEGY